MKFSYKLNENDYLDLHLFEDKRKNVYKNTLKREQFLWSSIFLFLAIQQWIIVNFFSFLFVLILGGIVMSVRYSRFKDSFIKNRSKQIREIDYDLSDKTLIIEKDFLSIKSDETEFIFNRRTIKQIVETRRHFFLTIASTSIIISKTNQNVAELREKLEEISNDIKIDFISQLDWKF